MLLAITVQYSPVRVAVVARDGGGPEGGRGAGRGAAATLPAGEQAIIRAQ